MTLTKGRPLSLTSRVLLFVSIATGFSLLFCAWMVSNSIKHHFMEQDADELRVIVASIERALNHDINSAPTLHEALSHAVTGHHGVFYRVEDARGRLLYQSPEIDFTQQMATLPPVKRIDGDHLQTWQSESLQLSGVALRITTAGGEYRVVAAMDMGFHLDFLRRFHGSLWLIMLATAVVTLLAAWFGIHQGHLPLRGLSASIQSIQTNRLDTRIDPASVPTELQDLVHAFNHMIERLQQGFERLSHFSDDIAHELRTPLTNLITQTQVTLSKKREPQDYQELLYSSLEELERLSKLVSDMLWLAKSENALIKPDLLNLDIGSEIHALFDFFGALAAEKNIQLQLEGQTPAIAADRNLLRRALSNLLSNALRHTPQGGFVTVGLRTVGDDRLVVSVSNSGSTIAPEHLPKLFDRFYRIDPSRQRQSEGAGLGLAITKSIVQAHGGTITATSDQNSTCFTINLPLNN